MVTATAKKTSSKSCTASQNGHGTANRKDANRPIQPAASGAAFDSDNYESRPVPKFDDLNIEGRATDNCYDELQAQSQSLVTPPGLANGQAAAVAGAMSELVSGITPQASSNKSTKSRKPAAALAIAGDEFLEETVPTIMLGVVLREGLRIQVDPVLVQRYLDNLAAECEMVDDPLGRSLLEEFVMLKIVAANLHAQSLVEKKSAELAAINTSACSVAAEMRRIAIVLKEFQKADGPSRSKRKSKVENETNEAPSVD